MLDVVVDHFALGVRNRAFDSVELLSQFKAALALGEHLYRRAKMTFSTLKAFNDVGVAGVLHILAIALSSPPG